MVSFGKQSTALLLRKCFEALMTPDNPKNIAGPKDSYYERQRKNEAAAKDKQKRDSALELTKVFLLGMPPGKEPLTEEQLAGLAVQFVRLLFVSVNKNKALGEFSLMDVLIDLFEYIADRTPVPFSAQILSVATELKEDSLAAALLGPQNKFSYAREKFAEIFHRWCLRVGRQSFSLFAHVAKYIYRVAEKEHVDRNFAKSSKTKTDAVVPVESVDGPASEYIKALTCSLEGLKLAECEVDIKETLHWLISLASVVEPEDICFYTIVRLVFMIICQLNNVPLPITDWDKYVDNSRMLLESLNEPERITPPAEIADLLLNILMMVPAAEGLDRFRNALFLAEQSLFCSLTGSAEETKKKVSSFSAHFLRDASTEIIKEFIFFNVKLFLTSVASGSYCLYMAVVTAQDREFHINEDPASVYPALKISTLMETLRNGLCYPQSVFESLELIYRLGIPVLSDGGLLEFSQTLLRNALVTIRRMAATNDIDAPELAAATEEKKNSEKAFLERVQSQPVLSGLARLAKAIIAADPTPEKNCLAEVITLAIRVTKIEEEVQGVPIYVGKVTALDYLVREAASCGTVGTKEKVEMLLLYSVIASRGKDTQDILQELFTAAGLTPENPSDEVFVCDWFLFQLVAFSTAAPLLPDFVEKALCRSFANLHMDKETILIQQLVGLMTDPKIQEYKRMRVAQRVHLFCSCRDIHKTIVEMMKGKEAVMEEIVRWASEETNPSGSEMVSVETLFAWISNFFTGPSPSPAPSSDPAPDPSS